MSRACRAKQTIAFISLGLALVLAGCNDGNLQVVGTLTAHAGVDRMVDVGTPVGLDGTLSREPVGGRLTFRWTLEQRPVGSASVIRSAESIAASFTPDVAGAYRVALQVSNGTAAASASVVITAVPRGGDLRPPNATITTKPSDPSNTRDPSFAFTSDKPGSRFECTIDGQAGAACTSPTTFTGLSDGTHRFTVIAIDAAGNGAPATYAWTIDTATPDTFFLATETATPPAITNVNTATFSFGATEPGTFRCALDDAAPAPCASGLSLTALADGAHVFSVAAVDAAGNVDPSPAVCRWTVDTTAPDTTLTETPRMIAPTGVANFAFTTNEPGATFRCALDEAAPTPCTSPWTATNLAEGAHTFTVTATDAAGNRDATPATHTWTVDTQAPDTVIVTAPASLTANTVAVFTFVSTEEGGTFLCALDDALPVPCTSPFAALGLGDGVHHLTVTAVDAAGNADPRPPLHVWTIDSGAPDTFFQSVPPTLTNATTATFGFGANEPSTFVCALDEAAATPCTAVLALSGLTGGSHTLSVAAVDLAGNVDPTPAVFRWTVDLTPPDTALTGTPALLTSNTIAVFAFTATEAGSSFRCSLDDGAAQPCASPWTTARLSDGPHRFTVAAVDAAGNVDPTPATYNWTVDAAPPTTTIVSAPASLTRSASATFTFTSSEPSATFSCAFDGGPGAPCTSPFVRSGLSDGIHYVTITAIDAAGNADPRPPLVVWTIDTVAPETTIVSGPASSTAARTATFQFTSSEAGSTLRCALDGGEAPVTVPCTSPTSYSALSVGTHRFSVFAIDAAGNADASPATYTWTIEAPPTLSYAGGPFVATKNTAVTPIVATASGQGTFSVLPALPPGLLVGANGTLSGTPFVSAPRTTYTVTLTTIGGTAQATLDLTVNDEAPRNLVYATNPASYVRSFEIANNVPTYQGGVAASFSVTPALPLGLAMSTTTGIITGTPQAPAAMTTYTITATNVSGSTQAALRLAVISPCNNFNLPFGFGEGTAASPHLICTRQHLENITQGNQAAHYRLENDLDWVRRRSRRLARRPRPCPPARPTAKTRSRSMACSTARTIAS